MSLKIPFEISLVIRVKYLSTQLVVYLEIRLVDSLQLMVVNLELDLKLYLLLVLDLVTAAVKPTVGATVKGKVMAMVKVVESVKATVKAMVKAIVKVTVMATVKREATMTATVKANVKASVNVEEMVKVTDVGLQSEIVGYRISHGDRNMPELAAGSDLDTERVVVVVLFGSYEKENCG